jgi:hypothetical protein
LQVYENPVNSGGKAKVKRQIEEARNLAGGGAETREISLLQFAF